MSKPSEAPPVQRRRFRVQGTVQGVGFRPAVHAAATALGLSGWVANDDQGVIGEVEGPADLVDAFVARLRDEPPPLAVVASIAVSEVPVVAPSEGFAIRVSTSSTAAVAAIPADRATCAACLAEASDPADRRYRYPFTNCTACGPRLTIATGAPYDRQRTTMRSFPMCAACQAEYDDPSDRRFHAEATCCPACGPTLVIERAPVDPRLASAPAPGPGPGPGPVEADAPGADPIDAAAAVLRTGGLVAVKGLGGHHLAVLASDEAAVDRLRTAKQREERPFAVLVADLDAARALCRLTPADERLLTSDRAPIVLVPRHGVPAVAKGVAPGTELLGLLLPYSVLHHRLIAAVGEPIVLTSANLTDEPMVIDDPEARTRLLPLVDALLTHDRTIASRVDDSVARVVDRAPTLLRRARGFAPEPVRLARPVPAPVLALGADLKSTVCVAVGDRAWLSPHLGDLAHPAARDAHAQAVERLLEATGVTPEVVAHDLHPGYASTAFAHAEFGGEVRLVAVQHHHAHVAACLAEHGHLGPALGVAYDGLGYGTDGTAWGGELLLVHEEGFERSGHLRPVAMPGGTAAIREPWRMALAHLEPLADPTRPPNGASGVGALAGRHAGAWTAVERLVATGTNCPTTTSMGRLFDAVAALCGAGDVNGYEGQVATALEQLARRSLATHGTPTPFDVDLDVDLDLDLDAADGTLVLPGSQLVAAVASDLDAGAAPADVSARFHATVAAFTHEALRHLRTRTGVATVALTGGVFQNAVLLEDLADRLRSDGFDVLVHRRVPTNDGGISLGQAIVASQQQHT